MSEQHDIRGIWKWRDKALHYRCLAGRKQSPRVRDLLFSLAREVESEADAMVLRRDEDLAELEDPAELRVPNRSMRLPTRIDMAATPLRDASRTVRVAQGGSVGQISTVYGQISPSQPAQLPAETEVPVERPSTLFPVRLRMPETEGVICQVAEERV
jgi:hypothetical protein